MSVIVKSAAGRDFFSFVKWSLVVVLYSDA